MKPLWARIWGACPVALRATFLALTILNVGQIPPMVALYANLRVAPRTPIFLPIALAWLWIFWRYLDGYGWPKGTSESRKRDLRAASLPTRVWTWSLVAGGLSLASVMSLALLTGRVATLPEQAYQAPFDLSLYPWWTVACFFVTIAAMAGVVEEAAFRGYLLSHVERRHGFGMAVVLVSLAFYAVHLSHAYATLAFVPFFAFYSVVHGGLVFLTRSTKPSVLLHAIFDLCILPVQYGAVPLPFGDAPLPYLACVLGFGAAAVPAFLKLRTLTNPKPIPGPPPGAVLRT